MFFLYDIIDYFVNPFLRLRFALINSMDLADSWVFHFH